MEEKDHSRLKM